MDDLQGPERADFCTDTAAGAVLLYRKIRVDQFKGAFRADRYAASAISTDIPMYFEH
jgi:hypothetical protein